jgi:hypothetical protein
VQFLILENGGSSASIIAFVPLPCIARVGPVVAHPE